MRRIGEPFAKSVKEWNTLGTNRVRISDWQFFGLCSPPDVVPPARADTEPLAPQSPCYLLRILES
jgi:hypothetical protein